MDLDNEIEINSNNIEYIMCLRSYKHYALFSKKLPQRLSQFMFNSLFAKQSTNGRVEEIVIHSNLVVIHQDFSFLSFVTFRLDFFFFFIFMFYASFMT